MILVTAATGTVGSEVVKALCDRAELRVLVLSPEKADVFAGLPVEPVTGDLDRPETLAEALRGVEQVFLTSPAGPDQVQVQCAAIDAAREAGVRHLVKLSTLAAHPDAPARFDRCHGRIIEHLRASGLPHTVLAASAFMQHLLDHAAEISRDAVLAVPAGEGAVTHVDARDVAAVAAHALTSAGHEGATYPVTGPEALTFTEIADRVSAVTGRRVRYVDLPEDDARRRLVEDGVDPWYADALLERFRIYREGGAAAVTDDVHKATGSAPRRLDEWLADHRAAFAPMPV